MTEDRKTRRVTADEMDALMREAGNGSRPLVWKLIAAIVLMLMTFAGCLWAIANAARDANARQEVRIENHEVQIRAMKEGQDKIEKRLERIEEKLDRIIDKSPK
jgi:peptidoglycan hydrolase CwlO-like protein